MKTLKIYVKNKPNPIELDFPDDSVILAPSVVSEVADYVQGLAPFNFVGIDRVTVPAIVAGLIREHFRQIQVTDNNS